MGKKLKNPIELRAVAHLDPDNSVQLHVDSIIVKYGVTCEHGLDQRNGLNLELTSEVENSMKDMAEEAIKQAELHEEIDPEDSMLIAPE